MPKATPTALTEQVSALAPALANRPAAPARRATRLLRVRAEHLEVAALAAAARAEGKDEGEQEGESSE